MTAAAAEGGAGAAADTQTARPSDGSPWRDPRYRYLRPLGQGGFGAVFLAFDRVRSHVVALKMLRGWGAEQDARLRTEFRILKDFDHPGLVELHELHISSEESFFTMEFVAGSAADVWVAGDDRVERALMCLAQLVDALLALHAGGVVHQDVKPSNVLVTDEGRVVLVDAGLARETESDRSSQRYFAGTARYAAPERAVGGRPTNAADWYGVGVTAFELLTGEPPFSGSAMDVLQAKIMADAPPIATRCAGLDAEDAALVDRLLAREASARPSEEELRAWARRRLPAERDGAAPTRRVAAGEIPFVGRSGEVARLEALFEGVGAGVRYALIEGPSGMGKTTLVTEWLTRVADAGRAAVFAGRCSQRESLPYNGLDAVMEQVAGLLADELEAGEALPEALLDAIAGVPFWRELVPRERLTGAGGAGMTLPPDPLAQRRAASQALVAALRHVAGARRLVVWVDDLQWGPSETAFTLAEIGRQSWPAGALVLCTSRPLTPADGTCRAHLEEVVPGITLLPLGPLSDEEARALVGTVGEADLVAELAERLVRTAGGHPLLLTQAALHAAEGVEGVDLAQILASRVASLDDTARRVLRSVCVARSPIADVVATVAADLSYRGGEARRLLRSGLLRRTGATGHLLEPFHDQLRDAVVAALPEEERRRTNLRLAVTLEELGAGEPEHLVDYFTAAGEKARAYALVTDAVAAMDARYAFERAAELCRLGLALAEEIAPGDMGARRIAYAEALVNCGRCEEAARVFLEAADAAGDDGGDALRGRAALELLHGGFISEGLALAATTFRRFGIAMSRSSLRALPSIVWRRLRLWRRGYHYALRSEGEIAPDVLKKIDWCLEVATILPLFDTLRGFQVHNQGLYWALEAGEPNRLARVLATEVGYRNALGGGGELGPQATHLVDAAETLARGTDDPLARAMVDLMRGSARWSVADWPACVAAMEAGLKRLRERCRGVSWELNFAYSHLLDALVWQGEYDAHERAFRAELEDALARGDNYARVMYLVRDTMMNGLVRDTLEEAEAKTRGALDAYSDRGFQVEHIAALYELTHFALYRRDGEEAYRLCREAWGPMRRSQLMQLKAFRIESRSGRARAALLLASTLPAGGRRRKLVKEASRFAAKTDREVPDARVLVLGGAFAAGAAHLRGEPEVALARLDKAAADAARLHMFSHRCALEYVAARLRGGQGGEEAAASALAGLASRGVARPEKYAQTLVAGFGEVL